MTNPWATLADARAAWPDAVKISDAQLQDLLDTAYEVCSPYAVRLPTDVVAPSVLLRWTRAVVLTARAVWTAGRASADGLGLNDGTDLALPQPTLSSQVLQLLRPPSPVVLG